MEDFQEASFDKLLDVIQEQFLEEIPGETSEQFHG